MSFAEDDQLLNVLGALAQGGGPGVHGELVDGVLAHDRGRPEDVRRPAVTLRAMATARYLASDASSRNSSPRSTFQQALQSMSRAASMPGVQVGDLKGLGLKIGDRPAEDRALHGACHGQVEGAGGRAQGERGDRAPGCG